MTLMVWRERLKCPNTKSKSTIILLIMLAFGDCILLVDFGLYESLPTFFPSVKKHWLYAWCYARILNPTFYITIVSTIWTITAVTVNRFCLVALPIKAASLLTVARSYIAVLGISIFSVVVSIPEFFVFEANQLENNGTTIGVVVQRSSFGKSETALQYEFWLHCIVLVLTPWLIVAVLNFMIIVFLKRQWNFRKNFQSKCTLYTFLLLSRLFLIKFK